MSQLHERKLEEGNKEKLTWREIILKGIMTTLYALFALFFIGTILYFSIKIGASVITSIN